MDAIEHAKADGLYRRAGQLQALLGYECNYGCHYGMRSIREPAMEMFRLGYYEVHFYLTRKEYTE